MIERLANRLKQDPKDANGWRMLGWSYFSTQRYSEAADAYAKAIELQPEVAALKTARAEAMVRAAKDVVTPETMALFDDALKQDPKDPRARYFKGLAKEQAGDKKSAVEEWVAILKESAPAEPWWAELRKRTAELGREIGADLSGLPLGTRRLGVWRDTRTIATGRRGRRRASGGARRDWRSERGRRQECRSDVGRRSTIYDPRHGRSPCREARKVAT